MNTKQLGMVAAALVALVVLGTIERSAWAQGIDIVGDGFVVFEDELDGMFLLDVDQIIVIGQGLDVSDDNSRYVAECGTYSGYLVEAVRPVDVILITRGDHVAFATLWGVFPETFFLVPHGVYAVTDSRAGSYWWWRPGGDPTKCFDAVAFDLVAVFDGP